VNARINMLVRWCKFNLVGVIGMAVQLAAVAILNRVSGGHYMVATVVALELTLLHNFLWHLNYAWRDRFPAPDAKKGVQDGAPRRRQRVSGAPGSVSFLKRIGFNGREPGADACTCARSTGSGGGVERDCHLVLFDFEFLSREQLGIYGEGRGGKELTTSSIAPMRGVGPHHC
jgi:hypothetical protein